MIVRLLPLICIISVALAEWSSDPAVNLLVSSGVGSSEAPMLALGNEGDCYVSWMDWNNGAYDIRLQRFTLEGNPLWGDEGILVRADVTNGEIFIQALSTGEDGTAYLALPVGSGVLQSLVAYRISKAGDMLWGASGVVLSDTSSGWAAEYPSIAVMGSGEAVISWTLMDANYDSAFTRVQRLSASGTTLWGEGVVLEPDSAGLLCCQATLCPVGEADVAVIYTICDSDYWNKRMYAIALNPAGEPAWASPAVITDSREVVQQSIMPPPHPDGMGGFYITWSENTASGSITTLVQHVDGNGGLLMPAGGAPVSTLSSLNHIEPSLAVAENGAYVFWCMLSAGQTQNAICGQLLDPQGSPLWPASGKVFVPLQALGLVVDGTSTDGSNCIAIIDEEITAGGSSDIRAILVDPDGNLVWPGSRIDFGTGGYTRERSSLSGYSWGQEWIGVWTDDRSGVQEIYAQNILADGTLGIGNLGIGGQEALPGLITVTPNPFGASASLSITLQEPSEVSIRLFDLGGRVVLSTDQGMLPAGHHSLAVAADGLPSGLYVASVRIDDSIVSERCVHIR
jgi:hypothetical protein